VALYIVPNLKYPANPPSVGEPETIGMRTGFYFLMMLISIAAMVAAGALVYQGKTGGELVYEHGVGMARRTANANAQQIGQQPEDEHAVGTFTER